MSDLQPDRKHEISGTTSTLGLGYDVAALACYLPLFGYLPALLWLITEPKANLFVRFHAIQSLLLLGALIAANIVVAIVGALGGIPLVGWIFSVLSGVLWVGLAGVWFVSSIILMLKAKEHEMTKLPYIGDMAEKFAQ